MKYDYLIVGAGFFGATFARLMTDAGKKCLVIDSRPHIAGNAYSKKEHGIDIHVYGPHIFHTDNLQIWNFVNRFAEFNNFVLSPKVSTNGKMYSLPFNMNTFYEMWGLTKPSEVAEMMDSQKLKLDREPANLEEQALSLVGYDIYSLLIRDYTKKQWKKDPKELPASIIKRLPVRLTYDNNYFNDRYQGIPVDGYTAMFEKMLDGIDVHLNVNYFEDKNILDTLANKVVFTGKIDEFYDYEFGKLDYRTLEFNHETLQTDNYQGAAVVNYPDLSLPHTRIIEHKHFTKVKSDVTIITKEVPTEWTGNEVPYYPINDDKNTEIYNKYRDKSEKESNVIFGGRLAEYRYYDMHQVIGSAMKAAKIEQS
jgi:UDP-galactopyranose mutase